MPQGHEADQKGTWSPFHGPAMTAHDWPFFCNGALRNNAFAELRIDLASNFFVRTCEQNAGAKQTGWVHSRMIVELAAHIPRKS